MTHIGGTGIYSDKQHKDAFYFFMSHSTFEYISNGSFGITIRATINPGFISPYKHLAQGTSDSLGQPVNTILLKLCIITNNPVHVYASRLYLIKKIFSAIT
jgi:hypothetical protein